MLGPFTFTFTFTFTLESEEFEKFGKVAGSILDQDKDIQTTFEIVEIHVFLLAPSGALVVIMG